MVYLLIFLSVVGMTAGQLLLKQGVLQAGGFPQNLSELGHFLWKVYTNVYVISAVVLTIIVALAWVLALSKADLSRIYPFMALSYVLVALFSLLIFKEDINFLRWVGIVVVCLGVLMMSRS